MRLSWFLRSAGAAVALAVLSACTAWPGGAQVPAGSIPSDGAAFEGLLASGPATRSASSTRYIFVVHGMGDTPDTYTTPLFQRTIGEGYREDAAEDWSASELAAPVAVTAEAFDCQASQLPPCRFTTFGRFKINRFVNDRADRVVVYTFYWHEDLDRIQAPFFSADQAAARDRSLLVGSLKSEVVVMGFGDAAAYLGNAGSLVREGLATGICAMLREAAGRPVAPVDGRVRCRLPELTESDARALGRAEFGFLTMSLGSRMLYDTLDEHVRRRDPAAPALAVRTRSFFMLANQLPLLGLGRLQLTTEGVGALSDDGIAFDMPGEGGCDPAAGFFALAACERRDGVGVTGDTLGIQPISDAIDVIAFHDPEDFLGFAAGAGMASVPNGVRFVEVTNRNAPVYLGLFANPLKTHATELDHAAASRLILCGARASSDGRLTPEPCD